MIRHCFRLLWQGRELLETGGLTVRLPEERVRLLFEIGSMSDQDMIQAFGQEDSLLKKAAEGTALPPDPNRQIVSSTLDCIRDVV